MKYPYVSYAGRFLPIIGIEIKGREDWVIFDAYVDSGAGYSIFFNRKEGFVEFYPVEEQSQEG